MNFKAALALSIALMPAAALAEGHANVKHYRYLTQRQCHYLTADELMQWGNRCPALRAARLAGIGPGVGVNGDLSDNKNELPNRSAAHAQAAPHSAPAIGHLGPSVADMQLGMISAHMIGAVTAATLNNQRITRANQAAYAAAHPAPAPAAPAAAPPAHTATPPAAPSAPPSAPPSKAPPAAPPAAPPSKPSAPPAPPSKPSPPAPPAPPSNPPPSNPPPSNPPPSNPPPHNPPHHPNPPSHPGNPPGHETGGKGGCSGRGGSGGHR